MCAKSIKLYCSLMLLALQLLSLYKLDNLLSFVKIINLPPGIKKILDHETEI